VTTPDDVPPLLSLEQLQVRSGKTFTEEQRPRVEAILRGASGLVRDVAALHGVDWSTADHLSPEVPTAARELVYAATMRELDNPKGLVTWSKTVGRWSKTERLPDGSPVGVLLSAGERTALLAAIGVTDSDDQPWSGTISARARR